MSHIYNKNKYLHIMALESAGIYVSRVRDQIVFGLSRRDQSMADPSRPAGLSVTG